MFIFAAAVLGLMLGSFLNALLFRFNTGKSVLRGRSRCMHCGHMLAAVDLVPVFS
ncbi:MAG: Peptidase A24A domain protein, partial [Parcubacteria group bacterium GW2011_GWA1_56_13]